ncbi:lipoma HMGIC fusion partner-like 3 protein [Lates japonicus]|uniref:Lipoma HMGIC fusion partner-like 3 protein n=1 Tax=Lates japonicus TaxID=270547 RepID=A0AAD3ND84_LATJO|nr:lipoma HMGIC fusion partner-like 3 protein [Lates japonicus]
MSVSPALSDLSRLYQTEFVRSARAVGVLWAICTLCFAIIQVVVLVQPSWIGTADIRQQGASSGTLGLFEVCVESDWPVPDCRGGLSSLSPLPSFQSVAVLVGVSLWAVWTSVLCLCLFRFCSAATVYKICAWLQLTAGFCLAGLSSVPRLVGESRDEDSVWRLRRSAAPGCQGRDHRSADVSVMSAGPSGLHLSSSSLHPSSSSSSSEEEEIPPSSPLPQSGAGNRPHLHVVDEEKKRTIRRARNTGDMSGVLRGAKMMSTSHRGNMATVPPAADDDDDACISSAEAHHLAAKLTNDSPPEFVCDAAGEE